jgi:hypothetical protein
VEEIVWGIEACKEFGLPIAATMTIGVEGDHAGVSAADCAVKMAQAGARIGRLISSCLLDMPFFQNIHFIFSGCQLLF